MWSPAAPSAPPSDAKLVPTVQPPSSVVGRVPGPSALPPPPPPLPPPPPPASSTYCSDKMDDDGPALPAAPNIIVAAQPPPPPVVNARRNRRFLCPALSPDKSKDGTDKQWRRPLIIFCLLMAASLLVLLIIGIVLLFSSGGASAPSISDAAGSTNDPTSTTTFKSPLPIDAAPIDQSGQQLSTSDAANEERPTDHTIGGDEAEDGGSPIDQVAEDDASVECHSDLKHRKCPAIRPSTGSLR